jgi:hypothetical protein
MLIEVAIKIILVSWFLTENDYIQEKFERIYDLKYLELIGDIITCFKCLTFWLTLICTLDIFLSIFMALIASIYDFIFRRKPG